MKVQLPRNATLSIEGVDGGTLIRCEEGSLWLTRTGDDRDYFLRSGGELVLKGKGSVVIESLADARVSIAEPPGSRVVFSLSSECSGEPWGTISSRTA